MDDDDCDCGAAGRSKGLTCGTIASLVLVLLFALSWDTVEPTEFGLVQNSVTGYVELDPNQVYESGRYFILLYNSFLTFPRNLVHLEFSDEPARHRPPIPARSGPDPDDKDTGGQPIELSVAFQYKFNRPSVPLIYLKFALGWENSFITFAQQAITNKAQHFTPRQYWRDRKVIEAALLQAVNETLIDKGFTEVHSLQLLKVAFNNKYEDIITNIQVQEQLRVTKNYQLNVTRVQKEVDILQSETAATIARINAQASREASVMVNMANTEALRLEQGAKAHWYSQLKNRLSWTNADFLKYVKIKSLDKQAGDKMVVGVEGIGA